MTTSSEETVKYFAPSLHNNEYSARVESGFMNSAPPEVVLATDFDAVVSALRLRLSDQATYGAEQLGVLKAQLATEHARYQWCANELLACDYGDNDAPGEQIGWRVYGWRDRSGNRRIYGASIDIAVDAALSPPSNLPELSAVKGSDGE